MGRKLEKGEIIDTSKERGFTNINIREKYILSYIGQKELLFKAQKAIGISEKGFQLVAVYGSDGVGKRCFADTVAYSFHVRYAFKMGINYIDLKMVQKTNNK